MGEDSRLGVLDIDGDRLAELKEDPLFAHYLLLGRISNSLRFAHTAPLEVYDEGTPRAARQLNGAMFLQLAVAQEALDSLRGMGQVLKDFPTWQEQIVPIFRDPEIRELERGTVRDLRRKLVFHFDIDAIVEGLGRVRDTGARLIASKGKETKDIYFPFADEVALAFLVPTLGLEGAALRDAVEPWLRRGTELSIRISDAIEHLMMDLARHFQFHGVWLDDDAAES